MLNVATRIAAGIAVLIFVLCVQVSPSSASETSWTITRASGAVYLVSPEVPAFRAKKGMTLEPGFTLATQGRARAILARGTETILVGPNTAFALSKYRTTSSKTTLLQRNGTLEIDVERRGTPHFTVETPYLAAVVKGTKFTVSVNRDTSSVAVDRGLVEVNDFASGDIADVAAGQHAATVNNGVNGLAVSGKGSIAPMRHGPPRAPGFIASVLVSDKSAHSSAGGKGSGNGNGKGGSNGKGGGNGGTGNGNDGGNGKGGGNGNGKSGGNGNAS